MEVPSEVLITFVILSVVSMVVGIAYNNLSSIIQYIQNKTIDYVFFQIQAKIYDTLAEAISSRENCTRRIFVSSSIEISVDKNYHFKNGEIGPAMILQGYSMKKAYKLPEISSTNYEIEYSPMTIRSDVIIIEIKIFIESKKISISLLNP
jgi:hypothetical protein